MPTLLMDYLCSLSVAIDVAYLEICPLSLSILRGP